MVQAAPGNKEEKVAQELLSELRDRYAAKVTVEEEIARHNVRGEKLKLQHAEVTGVFAYLYEKATERYALTKEDGIDLTAGVIKRGMYPATATEATGK